MDEASGSTEGLVGNMSDSDSAPGGSFLAAGLPGVKASQLSISLAPEDILLSWLQANIEVTPSSSETLTNVAQALADSFSTYSCKPANVHKLLISVFPDLQAQQTASEPDEIYYLGIRLKGSSEDKIIHWLQSRFVEDEFGRVPCKTFIDMAAAEMGIKTRLATNFIRKAFPNVYIRRSDRFRWYCGVSIAGQESTPRDDAEKDWMNLATKWVRENICPDRHGREKCSIVFAGLVQFNGKMSVDKCMAAVKVVFPSIQRKVIDRHAYYMGVRFVDLMIKESIIVSPSRPRGVVYLQPVTDEEKSVVSWLQKVITLNEHSKEKLSDVSSMISKRLGSEVSEKEALKLVRKTYPTVFYRKRNGIGYLSGIEVKLEFKPKDPWIDKLREVIQNAPADHMEKLSPILDLMKSCLQVSNPSKCMQVFQLAFPHAVIKKTLEGRFVYGVALSHNAKTLPMPEFTDEDFVADFTGVNFSDASDEDVESSAPFVSAKKRRKAASSTGTSINSSLLSTSEPSTSMSNAFSMFDGCNLKGEAGTAAFSSVADVVVKRSMQLVEHKIDILTKKLDSTNEELRKLREETTRSAQQKDALIVQLQQTLVMLCQQQVQKVVQTSQCHHAPHLSQQLPSTQHPSQILPQVTLEQTLANLTNGLDPH